MNLTLEERRRRIEFLKSRLHNHLPPLELAATWAHLEREREALEEQESKARDAV